MAGKKPKQPQNTDAAAKPHIPIVGVGASAGGLGAFKMLFQAMPPDPGLLY